jgi:hypothetical protein
MGEFEGIYLRLTEETNALDYLEKASYFVQKTEEDLTAWKWVVIALHGALYGFAVCACRHTSNYNVTISTKKGDKLIGFWDALEICQDSRRMKMLIHSKHLILTEEQKRSIEFLTNVLRNNFEHYLPKLWSIELHGMPQIAIDVLNVIRFLALEAGTYINLNEAQRERIDFLISEAEHFLEKCQLHKEIQLAHSSGT